MRLLLFVSAFGILISLAVLIVVIIKAKKDVTPPRMRRDDNGAGDFGRATVRRAGQRVVRDGAKKRAPEGALGVRDGAGWGQAAGAAAAGFFMIAPTIAPITMYHTMP